MIGEMDENKIIIDTTTNADDRISQLPDCILHHILSILDSSLFNSPADLVRTSVLSKKWFALTASFPILCFNIKRFTSAKSLSGLHFDREYIIHKFFKYVEYATSRFCKQNATSARRFHLVTELKDPTQAAVTDKCIRLILNKGVQEFLIDITGSHRFVEPPTKYRLPNILLSVSSLKSLTMRNCELPSSFMVDVVTFKSLKLLELDGVRLTEEGIKYITTSCPLLEKICICRCYGFKRLYVYGLKNLKKIDIIYMQELEIIDIDAPNLFYIFLLNWQGTRAPPSLNLASCKKLKLTFYGYFSKTFVDSLSSFPFLENLTLKLYDNCNNYLKLSSHSLRNLVIHSQCDLDGIKIDTPNLLYFKYSHRPLPSLLRNSAEPKTCLECCPEILFNTIWFQKLRRFLDSSSQFRILKLSISAAFLDVEELKMVRWSPYELEHLELTLFSIKDLSVYEAVVDTVLWCCRPESLTLKLSISLNDFEEWTHALKFTYEKLFKQEDERQTNIQFVLSSESNAKKHFSDYNSLLLALPRGQQITETITFIKEQVVQEAR